MGSPRQNKERPDGAALERDAEGRKLCIVCEEWRSESDFSKLTKAADGLHSWRKQCQQERRRQQFFGMTRAEILARVEAQGGCAVCRTMDPGGHGWHVDHDHACCPGRASCGKCLRGVLCTRCNTALGLFKDDIVRIERALRYLREGAACSE